MSPEAALIEALWQNRENHGAIFVVLHARRVFEGCSLSCEPHLDLFARDGDKYQQYELWPKV